MLITQRKIYVNVLALGIPTLIQMWSVPVMLHSMGGYEFGLYTLSLSLAFSLTFLELGMSSAVVRSVSRGCSQLQTETIGQSVVSALLLTSVAGLILITISGILSPYVIHWVDGEARATDVTWWMFFSVSVQVAVSMMVLVLIGTLKALDAFNLAAVYTALQAVAMYGVPATTLYWSLLDITQSLILAAICSLLLLVVLIGHLMRVLYSRGVVYKDFRPKWTVIRELSTFGGPISVHAIIGLLFSQGQRLVVGFVFGPVAAGIYQIAFTLVSKVHALVNAAAEILFPVACVADSKRLSQIYVRGIKLSSIFVSVPLIILVLFSEQICTLWVGSATGVSVAKLIAPLSVAFFFVGLSVIPYHIFNGVGTPSINVIYSVLNISVFIFLLLITWEFLTLTVFIVCVAYAVSNLLTGIGYQIYAYRAIADN